MMNGNRLVRSVIREESIGVVKLVNRVSLICTEVNLCTPLVKKFPRKIFRKGSISSSIKVSA